MPDEDIPEAEPIPPRRPKRPAIDPSTGHMSPKMALIVGLVGALVVGGMLWFAIQRQLGGMNEPEVTHDYFREPALPRALLAEEMGSPVQAYSLRYVPNLVEA